MREKYAVAVFILLSILFLTVKLIAQEINLTAAVDRNVVSQDETITLTITVSGNIAKIPKPKLPKLDDFDIYSKGTSRSFSFVNRKISSATNYTYSIVPKKTGKFTIGSCEITVKGNTFKTEPIEIEVVGGAAKPRGTEQKEKYVTPERVQAGTKGTDEIFIKTFVSKKTVYTGEELILTFKLYSRVNLVSQPQYIPPETKGFWKEDMGKEKQSREVINGREYQVVELNYALFPLTSGKKTISGAQLNCVINKFRTDPFSFGFSSGVKKKLVSNPIAIDVLPLPSSPANYSGAVGDFKIYSSIDADTTKQNEPITVITTITGDGNLRNIEMPEIKIPGFRIYESGSEVKISGVGRKLTEKKVFTTMLLSSRSGDFEVPELSFTYFSPKKKKYITKSTQRLSFTVLPGEGASESGRFFGKGEVEVVGKDIHFIKTEAGLKNEALLGNLKYFFIVNIILLGTFIWIFISQGVKERMKLKEDIVRKKSALRNALKIIEKARREAKKDNIKEAYELLHRSILQFFADRSNLSAWGTTEVEIKAYLREVGIGDKTEQEFSLLLEACNKARFSKEKPDGVQFMKDVERTIKLLKGLRL